MQDITRLGYVYKEVLGTDFNSKSFEDRLKLQKIVYLLENMGVSIGDYNYRWYKHGPYSQNLQDEILSNKVIHNKDELYLSNFAKSKIANLKIALKKLDYPPYSLEEWIECIASLLYIEKNENVETHEDSIQILMEKKEHLGNYEANLQAHDSLRTLLN